MNDNEKWLIDRLNGNPILDVAEQNCINRFSDDELSEADLSSCIDIVEAQLSLDALPSLVNLLKNEMRSMSLREHAAKAIWVIGSSYVETELTMLRASPSSPLRLLAEIALGASASRGIST